MEFHHIAYANANELSRDFASERPERIIHPVRQTQDEFLGLKIDDDACRLTAADRRGNRRSVGQDGFFRSDDRSAASGLAAH
jgi:hypothetical protein